VGYSVAFGGLAIPESDPYLEFYQKIDGVWTFKAKSPIDAAFDGSSFDISRVVSGVAGQAWFLAWRTTFGDTGCRVRLRLIAFDGMHVSRIWSQNGLTRGEVSVSKASIQLSFDKEYHSRFRVEEVLRSLPLVSAWPLVKQFFADVQHAFARMRPGNLVREGRRVGWPVDSTMLAVVLRLLHEKLRKNQADRRNRLSHLCSSPSEETRRHD
jgi:hypothetical protein